MYVHTLKIRLSSKNKNLLNLPPGIAVLNLPPGIVRPHVSVSHASVVQDYVGGVI